MPSFRHEMTKLILFRGTWKGNNGNKLQKVQKSAASAVGDNHQAGEGWKCNTNFIIYNVLDG